MVAYSFKQRFVDPIRVGLGLIPQEQRVIDDPGSFGGFQIAPAWVPKRQTIRVERRGRSRHARPGEKVQLYRGMRTKQCVLIGVGLCVEARTIVLTFSDPASVAIGGDGMGTERFASYHGVGLDEFAMRDGFKSWDEMRQFWRDEHGDVETFIGVLIEWEPAS